MTKQRIPPTALDLLKRCYRRYERKPIALHRIGFAGDTTSEHFSLRPWREGKRIEYAPGIGNFPYVNVRMAQLKGQFTIDTSGRLPFLRMEDEYWRLIEEQYLTGRKFYIRLKPGFFDNRYYGVPLRQQPFFPAQFYTRPAIKRGMMLNPRDQEPWPYVHWSAFLPEGTPEYDAIDAADQLARRCEESKLKPLQEEIDRMHEDLFEKLKLVPA